MTMSTASNNDYLLGFSLLYSCWDLYIEWDNFSTCHVPFHKWICVSYAIVFCFRFAHLLASHARKNAATNLVPTGQSQYEAGAGEFLLDLREKSGTAQAIMFANWFVLFPVLIFWSGLGTYWMWKIYRWSPKCMPTDMHFWFCCGWLALCCVSVLVHIAVAIATWALQRRVRQAAGDLRQLEDSDVLARWGHVSQLVGIDSLTSLSDTRKGLTPDEIQALPGGAGGVSLCSSTYPGEASLSCDQPECTICLGALRSGDNARKLTCGHVFHRPCIDLWLLRSAECPLCKRSARVRVNV